MSDNTDNFVAEKESTPVDADTLYDAACFRELCVAFPSIAHDMRGFLNNMALNFELLKGPGVGVAGQTERYCAAGLQQIRNMDKSLRWVIELLDREDMPAHSVDINALMVEIHAMVKSYSRHSRKNIAWKGIDAPVMIQAYTPKLRRALLHIMLTAIGATETDGKLDVELKCAHGIATLALQGEWASGQWVALSSIFAGQMSDTGNLAYATLTKAQEILRAIGGEVGVTGPGEGMIIEISLLLQNKK